jgi:hypothetical protein
MVNVSMGEKNPIYFSGRDWKRPQSISSLLPLTSKRNRDPVTVPVAPKKVSFVISAPEVKTTKH